MLRLEHVAWDLPGGSAIIKDINLQLEDRKLIVVTGPNGGGKTTLAKLIAGVETLTSGRIVFDGEDITQMDVTLRAQKGIAYAFQQPVRFKGLTVRDLLELSVGHALDEEMVCDLLGKVGLCANEYVDRELNASLSGGEIKRIEIASVLARDAKLFLFDEPEAGIDLWSFQNLIQVFEDLQKKQQESIVIISHQERLLKIADRIVVIEGGRVAAQGDAQKILPDLLQQKPCCKAGRGC